MTEHPEDAMKNTYSLDLLFLEPPSPERESESGPPISHVAVKHSTSGGYKGVGTDLPLISHRCLSFAEFGAEIERLQAELESIRESARRRYESYDGKRKA